MGNHIRDVHHQPVQPLSCKLLAIPCLLYKYSTSEPCREQPLLAHCEAILARRKQEKIKSVTLKNTLNLQNRMHSLKQIRPLVYPSPKLRIKTCDRANELANLYSLMARSHASFKCYAQYISRQRPMSAGETTHRRLMCRTSASREMLMCLLLKSRSMQHSFRLRATYQSIN